MNNIYETKMIFTHKEIKEMFNYSKKNKEQNIIVIHKEYGELGYGHVENTIKIAFLDDWLQNKKNKIIFIRSEGLK